MRTQALSLQEKCFSDNNASLCARRHNHPLGQFPGHVHILTLKTQAESDTPAFAPEALGGLLCTVVKALSLVTRRRKSNHQASSQVSHWICLEELHTSLGWAYLSNGAAKGTNCCAKGGICVDPENEDQGGGEIRRRKEEGRVLEPCRRRYSNASKFLVGMDSFLCFFGFWFLFVCFVHATQHAGS